MTKSVCSAHSFSLYWAIAEQKLSEVYDQLQILTLMSCPLQYSVKSIIHKLSLGQKT